MKVYLFASAAALLALCSILAMCSDDAYVVNSNISRASDNFEVQRRVVFYNGITGDYVLVIEGLLSLRDQGEQLEVLVKTGPNSFKKHFLGLSDNVTYFCEQLEPNQADPHHYRVTFKPSVIVPSVDMR